MPSTLLPELKQHLQQLAATAFVGGVKAALPLHAEIACWTTAYSWGLNTAACGINSLGGLVYCFQLVP
jgi:hypothetical protein